MGPHGVMRHPPPHPPFLETRERKIRSPRLRTAMRERASGDDDHDEGGTRRHNWDAAPDPRREVSPGLCKIGAKRTLWIDLL